jgi:hypothetical protein
MPSSHVVVTAEMLNNAASVACPRPSSDLSPVGSSRLLNWVVQMTERAERHLARAAEADAVIRRMAIDGQSHFVNDAAAGGSRAVEAARSVRAQAERR